MHSRVHEFGRPFRAALLAALFFASPPLTAAEKYAGSEHLAELLDGVKAIGFPGAPGPVCAFGTGAFSVVAGSSDGVPAPVVAAGPLGKGRIVVFGHEGYLAAEGMKPADTQWLIANVIRWTARAGKDQPGLTVAVVDLPGAAGVLKALGLQAMDSRGANWPAAAIKARVIICPGSSIKADAAPRLRKYVEGGGGMVIGTPGWGWLQLNPGKSLDRDYPANQLLAAAGLAIADGFLTRPPKGLLQAPPSLNPLTHIAIAAAAAEDALAGRRTLSPADSRLVQATLVRSIAVVPPAVRAPLIDRLAKAAVSSNTPIPTPARPIKKADPGGLAIGLRTALGRILPLEKVKADPAAVAFPGAPPADAKRVTRTVSVTIGATGYLCDGVGTSAGSRIWHSTGLYAAPGETIEVGIPAVVAGKGLEVQIGCHTDKLWNASSWRRAPEITRRFPLDRPATAAANAFGGLVYITSPPKLHLGSVKTTIAGAVEAPLYVHGKTTREEWTKARAAPGPWAEFVSDKLVVTVPRDAARRVDDPAELMGFWDRVLDGCADLSTVSRARGRAERFVHDVQISAGYMHSGYPIMAPLGEVKRALNPAAMQREGAWGYFHELGHNHQSPAWTFDGTVEVTCNLYSLYLTEKLCPKAPLHEEMLPAAIRRNAARYHKGGGQFATWQKDPFVALIVYKQMIDAFGWETFGKVFKEYRALPASQRPKSDADKRDQWLERFSRACGKNLAPAFDFWGIPVSAAARRSVERLPPWSPPNPAKAGK